MTVMTGFSGNEMFCLGLKGFRPGDIVIGNSVHSLGFIGGLSSGFRGVMGGEVTEVTQIIHEGRQEATKRIVAEAQKNGAAGISGMTSELRHFQGNIEFISVGSCLYHEAGKQQTMEFSTSGDGQELYCLLDSGYVPKQFVFSNVAYSIGVTGGLLGSLKAMARGEIKEFSDVFNATRHVALNRIVAEAKAAGANCVLGIVTKLKLFQGLHEMVMMGTAAHHDALGQLGQGCATSDLTCEETWSVTRMGYAPLRLVLGTAVYSLGVVGGLKAALKSFSRGEISDLTTLIYDAREHAIDLIRREASSIGADDVIGIKTHIHEIGSLVEFMAIGTAVKRVAGLSTVTPNLPPQAVIRDKDTWISGEYQGFESDDDD
ncbi:MAG TPA: heavy metal-binding domain-containing protein [Usitatibacter sp.]|nr:heavy metal-binding domain-containing protein [Usitatibacter sp.]